MPPREQAAAEPPESSSYLFVRWTKSHAENEYRQPPLCSFRRMNSGIHGDSLSGSPSRVELSLSNEQNTLDTPDARNVQEARNARSEGETTS